MEGGGSARSASAVTAIALSQQIERVGRRIAAVQRSLSHCQPTEREAIKLELSEWMAVLSTLDGHRMANEAAGIVERIAIGG